MPSKPNYNFQRAERDRAKQAKKEAKRQERAQAAQHKAGDDAQPASEPTPGSDAQAPPAEGGG